MTELLDRGSSAGTEELNHLEMVGAIVYQLTRNLTEEEIQKAGFDTYFVDHTTGIYPASAAGVPFNAFAIASKGDAVTDLHESMAAEQKAKKPYALLLRTTTKLYGNLRHRCEETLLKNGIIQAKKRHGEKIPVPFGF